MKLIRTKAGLPRLLLLMGVLFQISACLADQPLPRGLILNLDFQNIQNELIPNKALYPLHVPLNNLGIKMINNRNALAFKEGQSLQIPHSSLLEPFGDSWVVSIRFFALSNGIIMSQGNDKKGYVLYLKDGNFYAAIRTGHTTFFLKGNAESGTTNCLNQWITTDLKINRNSAMLSIGRKRVDLIPLHYSFTGKEYKIRLGQHAEIPAPFKQIQPIPPTGFTGAISSIKILRQ